MERIPVSIAILLSMFFAAPALGATDPEYPGDSSHVLWFLVMSDEHITARDSDGPERLTWLVNDGMTYVEPDIVFNCGDLTDGSNGEPLVSLYPGKQDDEWQAYRQILDDAGISVEQYIDLPGNHDQYSDRGNTRYLQYSLAGSTFSRTQHSIVIDKPWGSYHFLGIDTTGNDGAGWPLDNAGLDVDELLYILRSLEDNDGARMQVMFGHHPIVRPDLGFKLNEGSDEIQEFMGDHRVRAYFYGHTHEYRDLYWPDNDMMPVTLHENVDSFGKAETNNVILASIDNDNLQIRQVSVGEFPWVIVTAPADINQGGGNPWAVDVPAGMEFAPIRALGFTSDPFLSCQYSLDGGPWVTMEQLGDHRYEGYMDTRGMTAGNHTVEVRALPGPANGHKITFRVTAYACGNGMDEDSDGLTDFPDDPGCDSAADNDEYNDIVVPEPEPEPVADVIVADMYVPDASVPDAFDPEVPAADEHTGETGETVIFDVPGDAVPVDTALIDDPGAVDDRGQAFDHGIASDAASDAASDDAAADDDVARDEHSGGGCSAGGGTAGNAFGALVLLALAGMAMRRRSFN